MNLIEDNTRTDFDPKKRGEFVSTLCFIQAWKKGDTIVAYLLSTGSLRVDSTVLGTLDLILGQMITKFSRMSECLDCTNTLQLSISIHHNAMN